MILLSSPTGRRLEAPAQISRPDFPESPPQFDHIDKWLRSPPTSAELWQYALEYRQFGLNVFPLRGKRPVIPWKRFQTSRPSLECLRRLIVEREGVTGLAVVCGWVSGQKASGGRSATKLCVRDYDTKESFLDWAQRFPHLATSLPLVRTRRGFHVYFWVTREVFEKFKDGELRGESTKYVVLPPSLHPEGSVYRWITPLPFRPQDMLILDPWESGFFSQVETTAPSNTQNVKEASGVTHAIYRDIEDVLPDGSGVSEARFGGLSRVELEAVWAHLPEGPGEREGKLFDLARRLKGMAHLADAPAESLERIVRGWWRESLPVIRTKEWEETWRDFSRAWKRVVRPYGQGSIHEMIRLAAARDEPAEARDYLRPEVRRLVRVCRDLQSASEMLEADRFFLSCRTAAFECGFNGPNGYRTAARWIKRLVQDGVLELVRAGIGGTKCRKASEYRFRGLSGVVAARKAA